MVNIDKILERHTPLSKSLEGSIEKTEKAIKRTKERIKIDELEQDKMNIQTIIARVGHTPDC